MSEQQKGARATVYDQILALPRVIYHQGKLIPPILPEQEQIPAYVLLADVLAIIQPPVPGQFTLYKVTCRTPNHFYIGVTKDVDHRFKKHQLRQGAAFTREHGALSVEVLGVFEDKWSATRAETACVAEMSKQPGIVVGGASKDGV